MGEGLGSRGGEGEVSCGLCLFDGVGEESGQLSCARHSKVFVLHLSGVFS